MHSRTRWAGSLVVVLVVAGCDQITATSEVGVSLSAGPQLTSFDGSPWSAPVNLGPSINTPALEQNATLSPDELSLYLISNRAGGLGGNDIWIARRASLDSPWETPVNPGAPLNSSGNEASPSFSIDGHLLAFASERAGGHGSSDVYFTHRAHTHDDFDWGPPVNLGAEVNTTAFEAGAAYLQSSEEGATNLYFVRGPNNADLDIYVAAVKKNGETRGPATPVSELNYPTPGIVDAHPSVRKDGREVLFHSTRPGGLGLGDLYVSTRRSVHEPWSTPVNLAALNSSANDAQPTLSFDGRTLVFTSTRPGGFGQSDLWMSTRTPSGR